MKFTRTLMAAAVIGVFGASSLGLSRQHAFAASVSSGDLIRGQAFAAVYYMGADGFRYVFPNSKTYSTWYANFDTVKFITDVELAKIQIGGNVTYRPGVRMLKIDSDPKTYAVDAGGTLRHVNGEAVAVALYGATWNKQIDDVPDGFFGNYRIGTPINGSSDFIPAAATTAAVSINGDKQLQAPVTMNLTDSGVSPIDVHITVGTSVRFTNTGGTKHTATGDDLTWGTGTLNPGESFIQTFKKAGTFTFFDSYNSQNTGAVYVQ
jgi:plastocyanin